MSYFDDFEHRHRYANERPGPHLPRVAAEPPYFAAAVVLGFCLALLWWLA